MTDFINTVGIGCLAFIIVNGIIYIGIFLIGNFISKDKR